MKMYLEIIWNTSLFFQICARWTPYFYMQMVYADCHYFITNATVDLLTNDFKSGGCVFCRLNIIVSLAYNRHLYAMI
jgi:hypothetical protein